MFWRNARRNSMRKEASGEEVPKPERRRLSLQLKRSTTSAEKRTSRRSEGLPSSAGEYIPVEPLDLKLENDDEESDTTSDELKALADAAFGHRSKSEENNVEQQIDNLNRNLSKITVTKESSMEDTYGISREIRTYENISQPVHTLSKDIFLEIWEACRQDNVSWILPISQVCRTWRGFSLLNPALWSHMIVDSDGGPSPANLTRLLSLYLSRSNSSVLRITISLRRQDISSWDGPLCLLYGVRSRWISLHLSILYGINYGRFLHLLEATEGAALEALTEATLNIRPFGPFSRLPAFLRSAPALKSVNMPNCVYREMVFSPLDDLLPWNQLLDLSVPYTRLFLTALQYSPNLRSAIVTLNDDGFSHAHSLDLVQVDLYHLRSLTLRRPLEDLLVDTKREDIAAVFTNKRYPALETLRIECELPTDTIHGLLSPCLVHSPLSKLHMKINYNLDKGHDDFRWFMLLSLPHLTQLSLDLSNCSIWRFESPPHPLLCLAVDQKRVPLPQLRNLIIAVESNKCFTNWEQKKSFVQDVVAMVESRVLYGKSTRQQKFEALKIKAPPSEAMPFSGLRDIERLGVRLDMEDLVYANDLFAYRL